MTGSIRIGFTGDVMLGRNVDRRHRHTTKDTVWGSLYGRLCELDGIIINLECCLSAHGDPWTQTYRPFHFRAHPSWALEALSSVGVDCCALANNHVLDYGPTALEDTLDHLDEADIAHAGAGRTIDEARAPAIVSIDDVTIAIISLTDNTPEYAADDTAPGTAHVDIDIDTNATRKFLETAISLATSDDPDFVVASLHWGPNMVEEPPPPFETFARWLIDNGVDLVHGHSAHIFQGIEAYDDALILYDTGDFVDDYAIDSSLRNDRGFLFETTIDSTGSIAELRLLPTEIRDCCVHEAQPEPAHWCRNRMRDLSEPYGTSFETDGQELVLRL